MPVSELHIDLANSKMKQKHSSRRWQHWNHFSLYYEGLLGNVLSTELKKEILRINHQIIIARERTADAEVEANLTR